VGDIDFLSDFFQSKFQINSKKPGFGKEKSVEDAVTPVQSITSSLILIKSISNVFRLCELYKPTSPKALLIYSTHKAKGC